MLEFTRLEVSPDRYWKENFNFTGLVESVCTDMALIREKEITLQHEAEDMIESAEIRSC